MGHLKIGREADWGDCRCAPGQDRSIDSERREIDVSSSAGESSQRGSAEISFKDFTFPAHLHFSFPGALGDSMANGSVYEPAEMACIEFPCRAGLTGLQRTIPDIPAGSTISGVTPFQRQQEQHLTLDVSRNLAPPLFEALNRLERNPQEFRYFLLRFFKF